MMMRKMKLLLLAPLGLAPLLFAIQSGGATEGVAAQKQQPAAAPKAQTRLFPPTRKDQTATHLYWGDTHLHTNFSPDAYINGNAVMSLDEAYRFAQGEEVVTGTGLRAKLARPLDFLAVTDHSEYMGVHARLAKKDAALADWPVGKRWAELLAKGNRVLYLVDMLKTLQDGRPEDELPAGVKESIWQEVVAAAERYNAPGRFTALIGYEWSATVSGDNLHRNVLFRGDGKQLMNIVPFTGQDSRQPEDLWAALAKFEAVTGTKALAIPHNANVSNGRMFAPTMSNGNPFTQEYARRRARWEPVVEVTQIKGDGESHPYLSPDDEFADFENWDSSNLMGSVAKKPEMLKHEYARSVLGLGLQYERNLGVNPFKFGMIGSTDSHTGLAAIDEDNFIGKFSNDEPSADRVLTRMAGMGAENWRLVASGLAAVWAPNNTREAIFDAFERREVYATTGPRIQVRLFGGWDFARDDVLRPDYATIGYAKGVPMGGDLLRAGKGKAPKFMVAATKDPEGANLDRVQIVKGWLDKDGKLHERVYDVAWSGGRKKDPKTGKLPPVGNTVDIAKASYLNSIGAAEFATTWTDPDFDPDARAFYYVRVLQIPTPRWTAYDAFYFGAKVPKGAAMVIQDRAYTSPIWYTP